MGWEGRERSVPDWKTILENLKECLEGVLMGLEIGRESGAREDVLALDALDELDSHLNSLKRDLGV